MLWGLGAQRLAGTCLPAPLLRHVATVSSWVPVRRVLGSLRVGAAGPCPRGTPSPVEGPEEQSY